MIGVVLVLVALVAVAGVVYVLRHRPPGSIEPGIRSFRREMRAIAPPEPGASPDDGEAS